MNVVCEGCRDGEAFDLPFSMAFQPIVDLSSRSVFAHEALVRGPNGEGAKAVLSQLTPQNRYAFDQQIRVRAISDLPRRARTSRSTSFPMPSTNPRPASGGP